MLAAIAGTAREWFVRSPRRLAMIGGTGGLVATQDILSWVFTPQ